MTGGAFLHKPERARKKPKRLKRQSAKRAAFVPVRKDFREAQLSMRPRCEMRRSIHAASKLPGPTADATRAALFAMGCAVWSVDIHEPLKRSQCGSTTEEANSVAGCRFCHDFTEQMPRLSKAVGLTRRAPSPDSDPALVNAGLGLMLAGRLTNHMDACRICGAFVVAGMHVCRRRSAEVGRG